MSGCLPHRVADAGVHVRPGVSARIAERGLKRERILGRHVAVVVPAFECDRPPVTQPSSRV
jgi:hypothetical protein